MKELLYRLPIFVAPLVLVLLDLVTAYVFKIGVAKTGIAFDYILFVLFIVIALVAGGVI